MLTHAARTHGMATGAPPREVQAALARLELRIRRALPNEQKDFAFARRDAFDSDATWIRSILDYVSSVDTMKMRCWAQFRAYAEAKLENRGTIDDFSKDFQNLTSYQRVFQTALEPHCFTRTHSDHCCFRSILQRLDDSVDRIPRYDAAPLRGWDMFFAPGKPRQDFTSLLDNALGRQRDFVRECYETMVVVVSHYGGRVRLCEPCEQCVAEDTYSSAEFYERLAVDDNARRPDANDDRRVPDADRDSDASQSDLDPDEDQGIALETVAGAHVSTDDDYFAVPYGKQ